jgi:hypothetical protein
MHQHERHPVGRLIDGLRRSASCAGAALSLATQAADAPQRQYSGEYRPAHWGAMRPDYAQPGPDRVDDAKALAGLKWRVGEAFP